MRVKSSIYALKEYNDKDRKNMWDSFESAYYRDSLFVFKVIRRQKDMVFEGFNDT